MVIGAVVLACTAVWAGSSDKAASTKQLEKMKAEFAKCTVCKHMVPYLDQLGPSLKTDAAKLNDGVAIMHWVTDPTKVVVYRKASAEMSAAGGECMKLTDEQAAAQLCGFCQDIRSAAKAGANMSTGETRNGDIMVLTSSDAAVQAKLTALQQKCILMSGEAQASR